MSITVKDLNKLVVNKAKLDEVAKCQLLTIDKKINTAALNGISELTYTLPITFMSGVTSDRNILLVYVKIIQSLEDRGFTVTYNHETKSPFITISWNIEDDVSANNRIIEFLNSRVAN